MTPDEISVELQTEITQLLIDKERIIIMDDAGMQMVVDKVVEVLAKYIPKNKFEITVGEQTPEDRRLGKCAPIYLNYEEVL